MNDIEHFNNIEGEEWRTLEYLPDTIQVSSMGRVKENIRGEWFIKPGSTSNGVKILSHKGKSYAFHKLVADAFIPKEDENSTMVKHLNDDKYDNRVSNLARMTVSEVSLLGYKKKAGNRMKIYCEETGVVYGSLRTAAFCNGLLESAVSNCIDNRCAIAGLTFRYVSPDNSILNNKPVVYLSNTEIIDLYRSADSKQSLYDSILQMMNEQLKVET